MNSSQQNNKILDAQYYVDFYELEKRKYAPLFKEYGYEENSKEFLEFIKDNALNSTIAKISEDYYSQPEGIGKATKILSPIASVGIGYGAYKAAENAMSTTDSAATGLAVGIASMFILNYVAYRHMKKSQNFREKFETGENLVAEMRNHRKNDKTIIENKQIVGKNQNAMLNR